MHEHKNVRNVLLVTGFQLKFSYLFKKKMFQIPKRRTKNITCCVCFFILYFKFPTSHAEQKGFYILTYFVQPDRWQFNFLLFFQLIHHSRRNSQHTQRFLYKTLFCAELGEAPFFHFIRLLFVQRFWNLNLQTKREKLSSDDGSLLLNLDKKRESCSPWVSCFRRWTFPLENSNA